MGVPAGQNGSLTQRGRFAEQRPTVGEIDRLAGRCSGGATAHPLVDAGRQDLGLTSNSSQFVCYRIECAQRV
jgi:hypothetical protein